MPDTLLTERSESLFLQFQGKIIRNVRIKKVEVFGPEVGDTSLLPGTWLERAGNRLHIKTNDGIIWDNVIIKQGDIVDPLIIADNERILRKLSFIYDAKILLSYIPGSRDTVDVLIITKDLWSKGFDVIIHDLYSGRVEIYWELVI